MNQGVVWFNFLAFTLMFEAFAFAFWLLLATYRFFQAEFIPGDHAGAEGRASPPRTSGWPLQRGRAGRGYWPRWAM
jgi:hypothetical protein